MGKIKNLVDMNGPFMVFMGKLFWVIIINLVWIVSCLPVVSIGGATKAMYTVMFKLVKDEKVDFYGTYLMTLFDKFFTSFKLTITMIAVGAICVLDMMFFLSMGGPAGYMALAISGIITVGFLCITMCAFPLLAIRNGSYKETIKDSVEFILSHPKAAFGIMLSTIIFVGLIVVILFFPQLFMFVYMIFIATGLNAFVIAYIVHKALLPEMLDEE